MKKAAAFEAHMSSKSGPRKNTEQRQPAPTPPSLLAEQHANSVVLPNAFAPEAVCGDCGDCCGSQMCCSAPVACCRAYPRAVCHPWDSAAPLKPSGAHGSGWCCCHLGRRAVCPENADAHDIFKLQDLADSSCASPVDPKGSSPGRASSSGGPHLHNDDDWANDKSRFSPEDELLLRKKLFELRHPEYASRFISSEARALLASSPTEAVDKFVGLLSMVNLIAALMLTAAYPAAMTPMDVLDLPDDRKIRGQVSNVLNACVTIMSLCLVQVTCWLISSALTQNSETIYRTLARSGNLFWVEIFSGLNLVLGMFAVMAASWTRNEYWYAVGVTIFTGVATCIMGVLFKVRVQERPPEESARGISPRTQPEEPARGISLAQGLSNGSCSVSHRCQAINATRLKRASGSHASFHIACVTPAVMMSTRCAGDDAGLPHRYAALGEALLALLDQQERLGARARGRGGESRPYDASLRRNHGWLGLKR